MELGLQPAYGRLQGQIKRETIDLRKRASGWRFASAVTRKRPSLNRASLSWFKRRSQLRGGWGRRPQDDAPRTEAGTLGATSCCQLDPSHPALVTREDPRVESCLIPCESSFPLSRLPRQSGPPDPGVGRDCLHAGFQHGKPDNVTPSVQRNWVRSA